MFNRKGYLMSVTRLSAAVLVTLALGTGIASAQDAAIKGAITARQSVMRLYAFNIGQLGAMAQGKMAYDADTASAAASNLAKLSTLNGRAMWLPGSDNGSVEGTRALPAIWAEGSDIGAKAAALREAAAAMEAAAGGGLEGLQGAMGALGGACGACHKAYRAPDQ
jgi:cytochrome c556